MGRGKFVCDPVKALGHLTEVPRVDGRPQIKVDGPSSTGHREICMARRKLN
jgi:hypothetical protein